MDTTKQYEIWFTENNEQHSFTNDIANIDVARIVAEKFKNWEEKSNVRILEISNFGTTIKFNL